MSNSGTLVVTTLKKSSFFTEGLVCCDLKSLINRRLLTFFLKKYLKFIIKKNEDGANSQVGKKKVRGER